jgi:RNA polymerase sigma factor (sigma-70 family)
LDKAQVQKMETEASEWISKILSGGGNEYWGRIYERFKRPIFALCFRMLGSEEDAKDMTSDIFIRALENLGQYDPKRPFFTWLYRIARNQCIDHVRKNHRARFVHPGDWEGFANEADPDEREGMDSLSGRIRRTIDGLRKPQKTCFCLFYLHEKSYEEIVRLTGFTYDQVRSHIQNGRRKFKLDWKP